MMKQRRVLETQSIWDVCLQHYGSLDAIGRLLKDNPALFGKEGRFEKVELVRVGGQVLKPRVVDYFATRPPSGELPPEWVANQGFLVEDTGRILIDSANNKLTR